MTTVLQPPAPPAPAPVRPPHLLPPPDRAPLWINDLVHPARGHIASTRDGQPHVTWRRRTTSVVRGECGQSGTARPDLTGAGDGAAICTHCAQCVQIHNAHLAVYGLAPITYPTNG